MCSKGVLKQPWITTFYRSHVVLAGFPPSSLRVVFPRCFVSPLFFRFIPRGAARSNCAMIRGPAFEFGVLSGKAKTGTARSVDPLNLTFVMLLLKDKG